MARETTAKLERGTGQTYMESCRIVAEKRCGMLVKALLCVVEENAEIVGRINDEERIVKSITEVMTRIDAKGERKVQETLLKGTGRWGVGS
jgi:hypothetical protein